MNKKKRILSVIGFGVLITVILFVSGYRFSYKSALQARLKTKNIELIQLLNVNKNLDLALYKDIDDETYGQAEVLNIFHVLYKPSSVIRGYALQKGSPFLVVSIYKENKYIVFIKTNDPRIKYVSIGTEKRDFTEDEYENYSIPLNEVKKKPHFYQVKKLEDGSALFMGEEDEYEKYIDKNMIMGFDENGNLIADRRGLLYGRYLKPKVNKQSYLDKSIFLRAEIDQVKNIKIKEIVEDKKETLKNGIYGFISKDEDKYYILINGVDYWYSNISFTVKNQVLTISYDTEYDKGLRIKEFLVSNPNNEETFDKVELINNGNKEAFKILYQQ